MSETAQSKYVSFDPADAKEGGGGLFDNVNLEIQSITFTKEAPDNYGTSGNPIFAKLDFFMFDAPAPAAGEDDPRYVSQIYSCGGQAGDHFTISEDGKQLIKNDPEDPAAKLVSDCKWLTFTGSLKTEGVPRPTLTSPTFATDMVGFRGHFKRVADKARDFGDQATAGRARPGQKAKRPPSTLICVKLIALPDGAKATGGTAAASTPTPASGGGKTAAEYLNQVLTKAGKPVDVAQIQLLVTQAAMAGGDSENRKALAAEAASPAFLDLLVEAGQINWDKAAKKISLVPVTA